jgi:hypothetical protein
MPERWTCDVDHPAGICLYVFNFRFLHAGEISILVNPHLGKLLLHFAAVLADYLLIGEIFITSQNPPRSRFVKAFRRFQNGDGVELAAGLAYPGDPADHGLADAGAVKRRVLEIQIVCSLPVEPLDVIPVCLGLTEHIGYRIEAVLQGQ